MNEIHLETTEHLIQKLNDLPNGFIFRGQASSDWRLESSLERCLGKNWTPENARKFEDFSLDKFQPKFHLYDGENVEPTSRLGWLSIMQHYGAPTRLIDFTESPFVALYFAMETVNLAILQTNPEAKMAIYALNYSRMMDASINFIKCSDSGFKETKSSIHAKQDDVFDNIVDRFSYDIAWATEPRRINKRLDRQSGCFLVAGNRAKRIEEILSHSIYQKIELTKFSIPISLFGNLYALLRKMNLNSKSIYGDLQGLCGSIRMEIKVYSH